MCSKRCIDIWKRDWGQHKRPNVLSPRPRTPSAHPLNPPSICSSLGLPGSLRRRRRCDTQPSSLQRRVSAWPRQSALKSCRPRALFPKAPACSLPTSEGCGNLPKVRRRRRSPAAESPWKETLPALQETVSDSCPGQRLPGLGAAQGEDSRAGNLSGSFKPLLFLRGQEKGVAGKEVANVTPGGRAESVFLS